ncbi:hypothetical protein BG003_005774 [Podila horticola]|nr:hypothetical protein BG003_005774 [Podila horticola]
MDIQCIISKKMKTFSVILVLAALTVLNVAAAVPATPADVAEPQATTTSDDIVIRSGCLCNSSGRGRPAFGPTCCR